MSAEAMDWQRESLLAKSKLYFERASGEDREGSLFGLWCSLGLELLARAAVASISPALLAEPHREHQNLLYALNRPIAKTSPQSISASQVFALCRVLFPAFSNDDSTAALALSNRRNAELHSGAAAFADYPAKVWLPGFYRASRSLANAMGESLQNIWGEEESKIATEILEAIQTEVRQRTESLIAAHRKVFESKPEQERLDAIARTKTETDKLVYQRHHRVSCPACECNATVQGEEFGAPRTTHVDGAIIVRQAVTPRSFSCSACGLRLQGYAELSTADLGGQFTRSTEFSPEEFYGLIDPDSADMSSYIDEYMQNREYDNE